MGRGGEGRRGDEMRNMLNIMSSPHTAEDITSRTYIMGAWMLI
jgi:hypothetical protein